MKWTLHVFLSRLVTLLLVLPSGLIKAAGPLAQDYTVVFHNPDPEYYVEGCGLERFNDGTLVAVVPVVPRLQWTVERRVQHSVTHLLNSKDGGKTWQPLSDLPYSSGIPWVHDGKLYLFGAADNGDFNQWRTVFMETSGGPISRIPVGDENWPVLKSLMEQGFAWPEIHSVPAQDIEQAPAAR